MDYEMEELKVIIVKEEVKRKNYFFVTENLIEF